MISVFVPRHDRTAPQVAALAPLAARAWGLLMLLGLLMLPPSLSLAAEVRASLDQTQIYEGDRVLLTIEVAGEGAGGDFGGGVGRSSGEEPDLGPLHDAFEVLGVNTSQQTRIINGRRSDKTRWQVALTPKRLGQLEIPALQVGSAATEPLSLRVDAVPAGGLGAPGDEVWLEVELGADADAAADASSAEPLVVQQQVPLVVRAYSARPLLDYAIQMPQLEDAVLTRIGRDQGRMSTRDGQQYRVIERRYTLSPERSGTLRIPPIIFEAELKSERARRSPDSPARGGLSDLFNDPMFERMLGGRRFGPTGSLFERGEPARAQSEALVRKVAARAEGFSGEHWLPATALEIKDSWNPAAGGKTPELRLGEPATRTLTLIARGLAGNQIPEIEIPAPDGFRVYPERTQSETRSDGETLIGISRQPLTLIPIRGGAVELPRIEVPWWHTGAGEERIATVSALELAVAGSVVDAETLAGAGEAGAGTGADAARKAGSDTEADAAQAGARAKPAEDSGQAGSNAVGGGEGAGSDAGTGNGSWALNRLWDLLFVALIALGAGLLWRHRRWLPGRWLSGRKLPGRWLSERWLRRHARPVSAAKVEAGGRASNQARRARAAVQSACERNDPHAAATALLAWGAELWPDAPPSGLRALAERAERGEAAIRALERRLYGAPEGQADWQGDTLWLAVKDGLEAQPASARAAKEPLAPLYPR